MPIELDASSHSHHHCLVLRLHPPSISFSREMGHSGPGLLNLGSLEKPYCNAATMPRLFLTPLVALQALLLKTRGLPRSRSGPHPRRRRILLFIGLFPLFPYICYLLIPRRAWSSSRSGRPRILVGTSGGSTPEVQPCQLHYKSTLTN